MQKIVPFLWFNDKAEEAVNFYVSIFKNSRITEVSRYSEAGPGPTGAVMVMEFELDGVEFKALNGFDDAPPSHKVGLFVNAKTQEELDHLWDRLAEGGEIVQCGWLTDKYGFSWNIVPEGLGEVLGDPDPDRARRAMAAMLQMKKLDLNELRRAADGVAVH